MPASINSQGAWQIAPITFFACQKARMNDIDAQQGRVDLPAGQHQRIVIGGVHLRQLAVDLDGAAPIGAFPAANVLPIGRDHMHLCARLAQRVARLLKLGLLKAIGCENGDLGGFDIRHGISFRR